MMCFEYKWTLTQWYEHTPREIAILLNQMGKRHKQDQRIKEAEHAFHAHIHGFEYNLPPTDNVDNSLETPEDKAIAEKIEQYSKKRAAEIKAEFNNG